MAAGRWAFLLFPTLTGCVRELPASPLGALAVELFRSFDEDPAALPALLADLDVEMDGYDLDGSRHERLVDLDPLGEADLGGASAFVDPEDQMRAGLVGRSAYPLDDNLRAQLAENFTCSNARSVRCHQRLPVGGSDSAAFLAGDADVWRGENTLRVDTVPVDFWVQAPGDFRWVELPDGRAAVVGRTWVEDSFANDGGKYAWDQRFGVDIFIAPSAVADGARRFYATWLGPYVNGFVGAFLQHSVRAGLEDGFTRPDEWLADGETCDLDLAKCLADSPF